MPHLQKITVPINGMHCRSCELLIEDRLKLVKGVSQVQVSQRRGEACIYFRDKAPTQGSLAQAIVAAGYQIGDANEETKQPVVFFSREKHHYLDLGIAFLLLVGIFFFLKGLGVTNININPSSSNLTVPLILLVGLTAGFSTCMALVGGLVLGLSSKYNNAHPEAKPSEKFRPHLFFNVGRIVSYGLFGGLLGILGSVFQLSSLTLGLLTVFVGIIMLVMGLQLIEIFPWAHSLKLMLPKRLSYLLGFGKANEQYSHRGALLMGGITFFLPCGFTQAMQIYAVGTGSFLGGAAVMSVFAVGTMPGLLGIGGLTSVVKGVMARRFFKLAGIVVLIFSIMNISNGLGLSGLRGNEVKAVSGNDPNVKIENGVQIVRMTENERGYSPNQFTIKKGLPVRWIINATAPYSCASSIIMSKFNIRKNLTLGENIIEFTPQETGTARFSCSMGMYNGSFIIVDDKTASKSTITTAAVEPNNSTDSTPAPSCGASGGGSGGGCGCGGGGKQFTPDTSPTQATTTANEQTIKTTYTFANDIQPNTFKVKTGQPVKFVIDSKDNGSGCMSTIMVPKLYNNSILLEADKQIVMTFTPTTKGEYPITCAMGVPRGTIIVE